MPITKIPRNYLQDMTLADARLWFRYRCQIIDNIKEIDRPNGKTECTVVHGREGLRIYAGVATSARDMSVGEVISDHPP